MRTLCLVAAVAIAGAAHAGRHCEEAKATPHSIERSLVLAQRVASSLDASGAQAVVLARAGQDLSRYGVRWSHLGCALRAPDGWRVVHKLNSCGTATSGIWRQGLGEFFLDTPHRYEATYAVPTPAVQQRLVALLSGPPAPALRLHHAPYSTVSHSWSTRYQQSNQWLAETLAAAMDPATATRDDAQRWLRQQGYQPQEVRLRTLTRLGGRVSQANVAFDDHPPAERLAGRIATTTADSVLGWLPRAGLSTGPQPVVQ
jgi:hypothetical protein